MKNGTTIDMTHGPLLGKILLFSLPLMASNVLQLLFNAADIVVVGRFAGHESLAAVGSTVSVIYLFVNLLIGLSVGVNVIIARYLGLTGYEREISRMLHTAVTIALVGGAILGAIGIAVAGWVLDLISVPADVRPLAAVYMRIYFIGTPFNMLYNYGAAALRAKGDTRRPLIFLSISGVVNVILNLIFVIQFEMNVVGVALVTIISEAISALLVMRCLSHAEDELHFSYKKLCMDKRSAIDMAPYSETYCTDGYNGYLDTIFPGKHIFNPHNKNDTFTVEGVNADLRHYPYAGASEQVFSEKVGESSGSPHGFCYRV